ncbi:hypothetical protein XU18_3431 [Perkinsela sp. CCAP 1560/4]|nr:hypothetical protein XU18_3431 [Perkinsela sp. CCAP 1560/4]|eukprot:KNH05460.1 hypothetical protein XU18_3431 [Perkinsela sp. CCAP 1560/4]
MSLDLQAKKLASSTTLLKEFLRKDPESYLDEYLSYVSHWDSLLPLLKSNQLTIDVEGILDTISVVFSSCGKIHKGLAERLFEGATDLVNGYITNSTMHELNPKILRAILKGVMLLRSRSLISSMKTVPFFCSLLSIKDKEARKLLLWHITGDIERMNAHSKSVSENRKIQCLLYKIVQSNDKVCSRHALSLLIELYRRGVWNTELVVFFISEAVFLKHNTFCIKIALYFLLSHPLSFRSVEDDQEDNKEDPGKRISVLKKSFQFRKKNRGREHKLKKSVHEIAKEYKDDEDDDGAMDKKHHEHKKIQPRFDPLLLLRDPQDFAERLLKQLQKTTELFDVRILMMKVLSKLIAMHHLVLLPFYTFLQRYMQPYQRDISVILALCTETFHDLIPPEELAPLVRTIANHFIYDRASPDSITIALSTIREMCKKQPLIMEKSFLSELADYAKYREDRGVSMAAKSLIKLFREIQPDMLPTKFRGRNNAHTGNEIKPFASRFASETIPGMEKLSAVHAESSASETSGSSESESSDAEGDQEDLDVAIEANSDGASSEDDAPMESSEEDFEDDLLEDELQTKTQSQIGSPKDEASSIDQGEIRTVIPLYDHILSDAEFRVLNKLNRPQKGSKWSLESTPIFVDSSIIEEFSTGKQAELKEQKLEKIRQVRAGHSIGSRKKKRRGSSSHAEKLKTKPFQMAQRSTRVTQRSRRSVTSKNKVEKRNKRKNIKFRIRRGMGA